MRGAENRVFVCKQCQKISLRCEAYALIEEIQTVTIDKDGLEMVDDSEIINTVTKQYRCLTNKHHDLYVVDINDEIFNLIYNKADNDDGMFFKVNLEDTEETLNKYRFNPQELMERLFDDSL